MLHTVRPCQPRDRRCAPWLEARPAAVRHGECAPGDAFATCSAQGLCPIQASWLHARSSRSERLVVPFAAVMCAGMHESTLPSLPAAAALVLSPGASHSGISRTTSSAHASRHRPAAPRLCSAPARCPHVAAHASLPIDRHQSGRLTATRLQLPSGRMRRWSAPAHADSAPASQRRGRASCHWRRCCARLLRQGHLQAAACWPRALRETWCRHPSSGAAARSIVDAPLDTLLRAALALANRCARAGCSSVSRGSSTDSLMTGSYAPPQRQRASGGADAVARSAGRVTDCGARRAADPRTMGPGSLATDKTGTPLRARLVLQHAQHLCLLVQIGAEPASQHAPACASARSGRLVCRRSWATYLLGSRTASQAPCVVHFHSSRCRAAMYSRCSCVQHGLFRTCAAAVLQHLSLAARALRSCKIWHNTLRAHKLACSRRAFSLFAGTVPNVHTRQRIFATSAESGSGIRGHNMPLAIKQVRPPYMFHPHLQSPKLAVLL
jgi:hypothetical protein